jgi:magnesium transporter
VAATQKDSEKKQSNMRTISRGDLTWIDFVQPTEESTKYLAAHFDFHPMDLEDSLSLRQLSKTEEYPQYLFVIFHMPIYNSETRISTRKQWSAFVGDKFLITLHPEELKSLDGVFRDCEQSEDVREECFSQGSGYLLYRILDRAVDSYFPVLNKLTSLMEDIEDGVFDQGVEVAEEISIIRRDIITQRQVMFPTRTLFIELEKKLKRFAKIDMTIYFSDLLDHMNKICDTLDENTEVIDVFKDADYLLSGYRANRGIRLLTVMLTIVLPVFIVFGLFGVYSLVYGTIDKGNPEVFFVILGFVAILIGSMLFMLRRKHLI